MGSTRDAGPVVLHQREVSVCDDEASKCVVLISGYNLVISRRYHTRRALKLIDPQTGVRANNGVHFYPLLLCYPPFSCPRSFPHCPSPLFFSALLFLLCSTFLFPPSTSHPPSWIKLFIWSKPQPAGKQAVSTEAKAKDRQLQTTLCRAGMKHVSHW